MKMKNLSKKELYQRYQQFFEKCAKTGINKMPCLYPPEGGVVSANIENDGSLTMLDKRDGKTKKIQ